jgi:outer membrane immunogenic protein
MKKLTLTVTIFSVLCALAYAGPESLPSSGKEMKQVMTAPAPECPNWGGFYIGAFGGYKFSNVDPDLHLTGSWITANDTDRFDIQNRAGEDLDNDGGEAGGLIGYNFQMNHWVFGLEVDGGALWARDSHNSGIFFANGNQGGEFSIATSFETNYLVTAGARIGYAFCRWMPYVTGGAAGGNLDYRQTVRSNFGNGGNDYRQQGSSSDDNIGWMVGGGLEYAITNHWRVRGQYQYIDLGDTSFDTVGNIRTFNFSGFTGHHEVELTEHNASFALIFGF